MDLRCSDPGAGHGERRSQPTTHRAAAACSTSHVGHDNLFHGDKYKVSLQLTAINITNKYALYNFLSTFSGTHYVTPTDADGGDWVPLLRIVGRLFGAAPFFGAGDTDGVRVGELLGPQKLKRPPF